MNPRKSLTRQCPKCEKILTHKSRRSLWASASKNSPCRSCAKLGQSPSNKGVPWTDEVRAKMSKRAIERCKDPKEILRLKEIRKLRGPVIMTKELRGRLSLIWKQNQRMFPRRNRPNYNRAACKIFDEINECFNWQGIHAENGGEYQVGRFFVDYYSPLCNLVIEFDEKGHKYRLDKDQERERLIRDAIGCSFYRIPEGIDWREIFHYIVHPPALPSLKGTVPNLSYTYLPLPKFKIWSPQ